MNKALLAVQSKLLPTFKGSVFTAGNRKLPDNVLIVNLSSAHNCKSKALGLCKVADICYAYAAEHRWPFTMRKNLQVESWIQSASDDDIKNLLRAYIENRKVQIKWVRLNESGDFVSQEQVDQWSRISAWLKTTWGITTHSFTARADLNFTGVNFIVNASRDDVKGMTREYCVLDEATYDALPKMLGVGQIKCSCHCKTCHVCFNDKFNGVIVCRKHGRYGKIK